MRRAMLIGIALTLTACGGSEGQQQTEAIQSFDVSGAPPLVHNEPPAPAGPGEPGVAPPSAPQIAYTYTYGFRLSADAIAKVQEGHLKLCDQLGPARCRVVEMRRSANQGEASEALLKLQVSAPLARAFGDRLVQSASGGGAETVERSITAEDQSKQIVDADARIRTKAALVQRLTTLLETRSGNIAQAVEAERAINGAQEELEKGRAWLAEMRGRVAMSSVDIDYASGTPVAGSLQNPLREAFDEAGSIFARSLAFLVTLMAGLLPWAALAAVTLWIVRQWRRRLARRPDAAEATPETGIAQDGAPV